MKTAGGSSCSWRTINTSSAFIKIDIADSAKKDAIKKMEETFKKK